MRKTLGYPVAILVLAAAISALLAYQIRQASRLRVPTAAIKTSSERQATLAAFEAAWAARPIERSPANARDECAFISRTAFFVQKNFHTEIGPSAFGFYRRTVTDFFNRYGSDEILAEP